jgi:DtxR family manganese transport transcriptional regulator
VICSYFLHTAERKRKKQAQPTPEMSNRTVKVQAEAHHQTRQAHAMETAEDYLETIDDLIETYGEARTADLARRLGVSHVTVIRTLSRLQKEGYISTEPYRSIFLTEKGSEIAKTARERHQTVLRLLKALGVPASVAEIDAEGIEHHLSGETLTAFQKFLEKMKKKRGPKGSS